LLYSVADSGRNFRSRLSELDGVELVAVYNRTRKKAEEIAKYFAIPHVYDNPMELLEKSNLIRRYNYRCRHSCSFREMLQAWRQKHNLPETMAAILNCKKNGEAL